MRKSDARTDNWPDAREEDLDNISDIEGSAEMADVRGSNKALSDGLAPAVSGPIYTVPSHRKTHTNFNQQQQKQLYQQQHQYQQQQQQPSQFQQHIRQVSIEETSQTQYMAPSSASLQMKSLHSSSAGRAEFVPSWMTDALGRWTLRPRAKLTNKAGILMAVRWLAIHNPSIFCVLLTIFLNIQN